MSFFTRKDIGRIYVLKIVLPDKTVIHKIGMCKTNRSIDRMLEILHSWFEYFRYVPYTEMRLNLETGHPVQFERFMHKVLESKRYTSEHKTDGSTELFTGINELRLLHYMRAFDERIFATPLNLTDEDYQHLCQLIAP